MGPMWTIHNSLIRVVCRKFSAGKGHISSSMSLELLAGNELDHRYVFTIGLP